MSNQSSKPERLLATALQLFAANGYQAVGVDRIAEASGVAKMTLYKHFATKDALIEKVLERRDDNMREALARAVEAHEAPRARLKAVFDWHAQWFRQPDFNGCMFIKATEEFPDESSAIKAVSQVHKRWLHQLLKSLLRENGVNEPADLAGHLLVVLDGLIVNANLFRGAELVEPAWRFVVSLLPPPMTGPEAA